MSMEKRKIIENITGPDSTAEYLSMKYYNKPFPDLDPFPICILKNSPLKPDKVEIGNFTYAPTDDFFNNIVYDHGENKLIIGKFCSIAYKVHFCMGGNFNHNPNWISTYPFESFKYGWEESNRTVESKSNTCVGNDVWIGYDAHIMPGVNIGNGAIIASKSVVCKDVAPYTIVGGNPAKVIRKRFLDHEVEKLQEIQWWNWNIDHIRQHLDVICGSNIDKLYKIYRDVVSKEA